MGVVLIALCVVADAWASTMVIKPTMPPETDSASRFLRNITWLKSTSQWGHTGAKIEAGGQVIYIDPVGLMSIETLPKADLILVTHDHADHMSFDTIEQLSKETTQIVSTPSVIDNLGLPNSTVMTPGDSKEINGVHIATLPAYNEHHAKTVGHLGYVLTIGDVRIYFSGDTGLIPEMKTLSRIDIAFVNIKLPYSLTGKNAVELAKWANAKILVPIHWVPDAESDSERLEIAYLLEHVPKTTRVAILAPR
jgi:L-ascorbate metabolism protein UlaG (beta-lactamase superfamily)